MTGSSIAALTATMALLAVVPGPSDFAVVARSIRSGFGQALVMIAGILLADLLFIVLAVFSLAGLAETIGSLFVLIKYMCGAYLIWLGVQSLRSPSTDDAALDNRQFSSSSSFMAGLLITLGDPKAILFYMGLFPAFVDLPNVTLVDTILIMLIATLVVGTVKATYAYLANRVKAILNVSSIRRKLDVSAACVLIGVGVVLLLGR